MFWFSNLFNQNYRTVCDKNKICAAVDKNCLLILKSGFFFLVSDLLHNKVFCYQTNVNIDRKVSRRSYRNRMVSHDEKILLKIVACFKIRLNVVMISQKFSYSNFKTESLRDAEIFTCNVREKPLDFMLKMQSIIRSHFVLAIVRSILLLFKFWFKKSLNLCSFHYFVEVNIECLKMNSFFIF